MTTRWFNTKFNKRVSPPRNGVFDRNELKQVVKVRVFNTDKPEDLAELERIYNEAAQGKIMVGTEEKQWVPGNNDALNKVEGHWTIFLRWSELSIVPKEANRTEGVNLNASSQHPADQ